MRALCKVNEWNNYVVVCIGNEISILRERERKKQSIKNTHETFFGMKETQVIGGRQRRIVGERN